MNKVQAQTKQADTKKAVSTTNTSKPTKEVETMNTATAQATVKTSDVAKNPANIASNKDAAKQPEQPKADNKMNTVANNTYQNAKDGVKVEDTKAAAPVAPKTEQTNSTTAVKEEKMTEAKKTLTFIELKARIDELSALGSEISDELDEELDGLKATFKKMRNERQSQLVKVQTSITQFVADGYNLKDMLGGFTDVELKSLVMGAKIKPTELFDIAVLKEVVGIGSSKKKADNDGEEGAEKRTRAPAEPRPSDSKPLLIKDMDANKRAFEYRQGRVFELKKQGKPYQIIDYAHKDVFNSSSKFLSANRTKEALEKNFTEEGKTYFATPEGKKELEIILEAIKLTFA